MRVGLIGLGRMGAPMAQRISEGGHRVAGHDIVPERRALAFPGFTFADSPATAVTRADVVITSLPGPAEVDDVVYGQNGLMQSLMAGTVLIETSTISPQQSRKIAADLAMRDAVYLDAPISGGAQGARDGTLVAMVGGPTEALERARPVLSCFASRIFHLGPVGAGNTMKLVIQSIFLAQMAGFLEAVSLGERCGIPLDNQLQIIAASSAHHPTIGTRYDKLRTGNLDPMFEVRSAMKDLSLAEEMWRDLGVPFATLASALSDFKAAAAGGFAEADLIALRDWLKDRAPRP